MCPEITIENFLGLAEEGHCLAGSDPCAIDKFSINDIYDLLGYRVETIVKDMIEEDRTFTLSRVAL